MAFGRIGLSSSESEADQDMAEINIVPLVDVLLVLLVIFMITAPVSIGGIKVQLPLSGAKGNTVDEEKIVLSITEKGDFYLGEKMKVAPEALEAKFKAMYEYRKKKELYIRADKGVRYENVVFAMGAAKLAGVSKLAMLTKMKGKEKSKK